MNVLIASLDVRLVSGWLLSWLWQALCFGTLLAALTGLTTRVLRTRVSPAVHTLLWCTVLIKFLLPIGLCGAFLPADLHVPGAHAAMTGTPAPDWGTPDGGPETPPLAATPATRITGSRAVPRVWDWTLLLACAYALALIVHLAVRACRYQVFYTHCRALPPADEATRRLVARVCRRLGVSRIPATSISGEPPAPFVMGLFRPVLVLNRRQLVLPDELETVIVHEVAHLRRGDLLVRLLQLVAGTLLFFWPIVAWVNRRIDRARELACDEWALRHGRLTATAYARCLLKTLRARQAGPPVWSPVCMAAQHSDIERRIDVILSSKPPPATRLTGRLPTVALLLTWSALLLIGATAPASAADGKAWPATEEAVKTHATELYNLTFERKVADLDGDGNLTYLEKDTYLVALAMLESDAFMQEFPYADRNHSERLDFLEAYDVIRAITLVAYADRRPLAASEETLALEFCHAALDAQKWLLDNVAREPSARDLDNIWSVLRRIQGPPGSYSMRMLNHGAPQPVQGGARDKDDRASRFRELEANVASIQAKLAKAVDPAESARLEAMLGKLEALLAKLTAIGDNTD